MKMNYLTIIGDKVAAAYVDRHMLILVIICVVVFLALVAFLSIFLIRRYTAKRYPSQEKTAEILRDFDSKLVHRIEWVAQPPVGRIPPLNLPVPYVILMETTTANCTEKAACIIHVRLLQMVHIEGRSWLDIGYNFLVGGDGLVYEGRGWKQEGAHTYGYNARSIGIAFIGTFINSMPTEAQIRTMQNVIKIGVDVGYISEDYKLLAARQVSPDGGPGKELYRNITRWPHWSPTP